MQVRLSSGEAVELPKLTVSLRRKVMAPDALTGDERLRAEWDALRAVLPAEAVAGELDGDRFEAVDVVALERLWGDVRHAYDEPMVEQRRRAIADALGALDADGVENLARVAEAMRALDSRQGFRAVR